MPVGIDFFFAIVKSCFCFYHYAERKGRNALDLPERELLELEMQRRGVGRKRQTELGPACHLLYVRVREASHRVAAPLCNQVRSMPAASTAALLA